MDGNIVKRLAAVRQHVAECAVNAGRSPDEITILGVGKFHSAKEVAGCILAGLKDVGENRLQEAEIKRPLVDGILRSRGVDPETVRWHFIGTLQSNKAARIVRLFDVVQSVDSIRLAERLSKAAVEYDKTLDLFIEVNTSGEASKSGIEPSETLDLATEIVKLQNVRLCGLMTIGPLTDDEGVIKSAFQRLVSICDDIQQSIPGLSKLGLSMGMSDDYPLAIAAGSTMIRIGTAIFGSRQLTQGSNF
jgi:pyridoxal phosphate enzyme (YggS family)